MLLISFKSAQIAHTFADYMATKGIILRVSLDLDGNSQLFLENQDENALNFTKYELEQYLQNPYEKRYAAAAWQIENNSSPLVKKLSLSSVLPKIVVAGPITVIITIICIIMYILLLSLGSLHLLLLFGYPSIDNYEQFWRYLTPIFIHFSLMHIIFNLMWWWYLGGMLEKQKEAKKLIELTLIAGVLSNYAQATVSSIYFGGLSGVVYALIGYVWLYGEKIKSSKIKLERPMIIIAIIWLIAGYFDLLGNVANTAHLVGLIVGLSLALKDIWLFKIKSKKNIH